MLKKSSIRNLSSWTEIQAKERTFLLDKKCYIPIKIKIVGFRRNVNRKFKKMIINGAFFLAQGQDTMAERQNAGETALPCRRHLSNYLPNRKRWNAKPKKDTAVFR